MRALIVEDDVTIADFLAQGLREAGFAVDRATDGEEALARTRQQVYDVAIVDLMLPRRDGLSVIDEMRRHGIGTPVLIPEDYVADLSVRLALYRRLADLEDERDIDAFGAELADRFGALPSELFGKACRQRDSLHVYRYRVLYILAVAAGHADRHRYRQTAGGLQHHGVAPRQAVEAQLQPPQAIAFMRIGARQENDQLRRKTRQHGRQRTLQCL